jgi:hypothetical protein
MSLRLMLRLMLRLTSPVDSRGGVGSQGYRGRAGCVASRCSMIRALSSAFALRCEAVAPGVAAN